jgi:hypothetical protein
LANRFREAIEIQPRPGRGWCFFALTLACSAALSVAVADIPGLLRVLAVIVIVVSALADTYHRVSPEGSHYVARAVLLADGRWTVFGRGGEPISARLSGAWGVAWGPVIALEWQCDDGRRRRAWLLRRDLPRPVWRRLRVRLGLA